MRPYFSACNFTLAGLYLVVLQMSRAIAESKCFIDGHNMQSFKVGEVVDPNTKVIVGQYKVLCTFCGLSDKQIKDYKPLPKNGPMYRVADELRAWRMRKPDGNPSQQ